MATGVKQSSRTRPPDMNTLHGKTLDLSSDPALIRRQLAGEPLTREQAGALAGELLFFEALQQRIKG